MLLNITEWKIILNGKSILESFVLKKVMTVKAKGVYNKKGFKSYLFQIYRIIV